MNYYFYYKNTSRNIVPVEDKDLNIIAKNMLEDILQKHKNEIPQKYLEDWDNVKLYSPTGKIEKAKALIINEKDGAYDLSNKLNELTGKEWTKFTCSWFIFNALASDLKEEKAVTKDTELHPATFSPTMISEFVNFFTKNT